MNIDIESINTIENINKVHTKRCQTIYEVIQPYCFRKTDIFMDDFIKQCKDNENKAQFVPLEVKVT